MSCFSWERNRTLHRALASLYQDSKSVKAKTNEKFVEKRDQHTKTNTFVQVLNTT